MCVCVCVCVGYLVGDREAVSTSRASPVNIMSSIYKQASEVLAGLLKREGGLKTLAFS